MGEYLLRAFGGGRFEVHSAGARPTGRVNPFAIRVLREEYGIDASDARSKSWDEFRDTSFDYVITVCDNARDACPAWLGAPVVAHWGLPDPVKIEGTDEEKYTAFKRVAAEIARHVGLLCRLPPEKGCDAS
jgi:arsenate reductase